MISKHSCWNSYVHVDVLYIPKFFVTRYWAESLFWVEIYDKYLRNISHCIWTFKHPLKSHWSYLKRTKIEMLSVLNDMRNFAPIVCRFTSGTLFTFSMLNTYQLGHVQHHLSLRSWSWLTVWHCRFLHLNYRFYLYGLFFCTVKPYNLWLLICSIFCLHS